MNLIPKFYRGGNSKSAYLNMRDLVVPQPKYMFRLKFYNLFINQINMIAGIINSVSNDNRFNEIILKNIDLVNIFDLYITNVTIPGYKRNYNVVKVMGHDILQVGGIDNSYDVQISFILDQGFVFYNFLHLIHKLVGLFNVSELIGISNNLFNKVKIEYISYDGEIINNIMIINNLVPVNIPSLNVDRRVESDDSIYTVDFMCSGIEYSEVGNVPIFGGILNMFT